VVQYPNLAAAKAAWIMSAQDAVRADELLAKPWDGLAPEVASAFANRLLSEERPKEALEVLQRAHSSTVTLEYWTTYSVALLKYQEQAAEDGPELLAEALKALDAAYKLCGGEGLKERKLQILLNIGYVHRRRGDLDEEWRALQVAHEVDPEHQDVRVRMAKVLTDRGRTEEAIPIYEELLKNGPEYVPFLLGAALAKRNAGADLQRATDLFEQTAKMAEPVLRLDGAEALIKVSRKMKQWERALAACVDFADVLGTFRSKELEASIHIDRGDTESAHSVLVEMTANESDITEEQRRTLGVLLQYVGDSERAFGVLELVALRNEWNDSTAALIKAAQATGRDEFTIRICRQLRTSGIARNSVVDAEAAALAKRGEVAAAIGVVEQALAAQEDPFLRLRLSTLGIAARRPELIEKDPSRLPRPGDGDPHVSVVTVGVLRAAGAHEVAIRYAYDAYRANRSSVEGWRAIIEAFMPMFGPTNHVEPDVVSVDAAVLVGEGKDHRWIIIEATDPETEHGELSPDNPLVVAMLGKKVGESVELPRSPLPPRIYRVEEIRSKYVRAYHRCLEQWEESFPEVPGPLMIEVPENLAENVEEFTNQLIPMLQQRARRVEELDQLYQDKPVTFHMLASGLGRSVFGVMGHLIAETDIALRCTRANPAEMRQLLFVLEGGQKAILEVSALSTLLLLEESKLLSTSLQGRIAIAQSTMDELRSHLREVETRGSGYMGYRDGRMTMGEIDDAGRAKYINLVSDLLTKASECEVFQEVEHDHLTHDEWDRLVKIGGAGAVESLHRAMRTGEPVWCDDMTLALVANERGVGVVWTQLMCQHLLDRSAMSEERAHRISAKLVGWRFTSTNTTPGIYLEAARLATWNPEHWPLFQHLRLFEVEPWDERSTVILAVNVLREWWRHAPSDATANAVTVALLERIAARANGGVLLELIDRVLERAFGVDVLNYQRAQAALDAWARARPLRRGVAIGV
jgi:tetratricopeptide (TPR) repeat protein